MTTVAALVGRTAIVVCVVIVVVTGEVLPAAERRMGTTTLANRRLFLAEGPASNADLDRGVLEAA